MCDRFPYDGATLGSPTCDLPIAPPSEQGSPQGPAFVREPNALAPPSPAGLFLYAKEVRTFPVRPSAALENWRKSWRPQGDSNPRYRRERAVSWASRRWGP